jgi:hypothetical protein
LASASAEAICIYGIVQPRPPDAGILQRV